MQNMMITTKLKLKLDHRTCLISEWLGFQINNFFQKFLNYPKIFSRLISLDFYT